MTLKRILRLLALLTAPVAFAQTSGMVCVPNDACAQPALVTILSDRVASDLPNATTTFGAITGLSFDVTTTRFYTGRAVLRVDDTTAAEGVKLDFAGGTATATAFWAECHQVVGGTVVIGASISTSLAGVINMTTITGDTYLECNFALTPSAGGTLVPRFAQNAHATGTATVRVGSFWTLNDNP